MAAFLTKRSGFQRDAVTADDRSDAAAMSGWLKKLSKKGIWQSRFFALSNGFLNYYDKESRTTLLASIALDKCAAAEPIDMHTGDFSLIFDDDTTYSLRAPDGRALSAWCDAIAERIDWAKANAGSGGGATKGGAKSGAKGRRGGGGDEDAGDDGDDGEEGRRRRRGRRASADGNEGGSGRASATRAEPARPEPSRPGGTAFRNKRDDDDKDDDDLDGEGDSRRAGGAGSSSSSSSNSAAVVASGNDNGGGAAKRSGARGRGGGGGDSGDDSPEPPPPPRNESPPRGLRGGERDRDRDRDRGGDRRGGSRGEGAGADSEDYGDEAVGRRRGAGASFAMRGGLGGRDGGAGSGAGAGATGQGESRRPIAAAAAAPDSDDELDGRGAAARGGAGTGGGGLRSGGGLAGGRGRFASPASPLTPRQPPGPALEGWAKKKASTKMGEWQARYLRLAEGVLYFAEDEQTRDFVNVIDVATITDVRAAAASARDRKAFVVSTTFQPDVVLRAVDEAAAAAWVARLAEAIRHRKLYPPPAKGKGNGAGRKGGRRARDDSGDEGDGPLAGAGRGRAANADSDADSDEDGGLPPPPSWYRNYERADEKNWPLATQKMLNRLFADIYQKPEDKAGGAAGCGGEDDAVSGDGDERKVVVTKLAKAATRACAELEDRVMELRMRGRADVIRHLVQFFDQMFLNELGPLTTGRAPEALSGKQLLQLIDCVEGYGSVRKRALGAATLSAQESRPGALLREARVFLIKCYMDAMGPKLHAIAEKVLSKLKGEKEALVREVQGERLGTRTPTDLFTIMSEHMQIAKTGGSTNLQRRLLSAVMAEVVFYAQSVYSDMLDTWTSNPDAMNVDFVIAVINDAGITLDHIEQIEAYFAEALAHESAAAAAGGSAPGGPAAGGPAATGEAAPDEFELLEAEQAREDLAAVEQDIPRAKEQLLHSAFQLTGVLVDMITDDSRKSFASLFGKEWESGHVVTGITELITDYFLNTIGRRLDPFFYERVCSMVLAHVVEQYLLRLLTPDSLRKDRKNPFKGGFGRSFKVTEDRLKQVATDVVEIGRCFTFMPREDLHHIMAALKTAMEMLTSDADTLLTVMEVAMRNSPVASTHIYLAFERCVDLREDLSKKDRADLKAEAKKVLLDVGEPPAEDDDLFSAQAGGVMHGVSMSQGMDWRPQHVTIAIYKSLFPAAAKEAQTLFAGWEPRPANNGLGAAATSPAPEMSMAGFLGGGGSGGGVAARDELADTASASPAASAGGALRKASPAPAAKLGLTMSSLGLGSFGLGLGAKAKAAAVAATTTQKDSPVAEAGAAAPSFTAAPARAAGAGRRRRGRRGEDDED